MLSSSVAGSEMAPSPPLAIEIRDDAYYNNIDLLKRTATQIKAYKVYSHKKKMKKERRHNFGEKRMRF